MKYKGGPLDNLGKKVAVVFLLLNWRPALVQSLRVLLGQQCLVPGASTQFKM